MKTSLPTIGLFLLLALGLAISCSSGTERPSSPAPGADTPTPAAAGPASTSNTVVIETNTGPITITLFPDKAPDTVAQFKRLVASGFYNQTTFHRVSADSLIQGGDPLSRDPDPYNDGQGTANTTIEFETNDLPMTAGAVAMAGEPGTASCQFFICVKDHPKWQGKYTIFGRVTDGMDVVRTISRCRVGTGRLAEHPITRQLIRRIRFLDTSHP